MKKILPMTVIVLATSIVPALAWFDQGHMMVAAIAYDQLTPKAKTRVAQLLALSKYPTNGMNDAGPADQAKAAFMIAATSPDAIKMDRTHFKDDGQDPTNTRKAPNPSRNSGFDDKYMHKYWHYVDIPFSPDGTALIQPPDVNARERIGLFRRTIASNAPDELKAFDLVWLLHLVGDVHQPLHATSRFTHAGIKGDTGGNDVKLCALPCKDELHAFWDGVPGDDMNVSTAIIAAGGLTKPDQALASRSDEAVWVQESFVAAQNSVYVDPVGVGNGPFALTVAYKANAKKVAEDRIALAGARLGNLLNTELR
jgi:S1/P1 Nuclease